MRVAPESAVRFSFALNTTYTSKPPRKPKLPFRQRNIIQTYYLNTHNITNIVIIENGDLYFVNIIDNASQLPKLDVLSFIKFG